MTTTSAIIECVLFLIGITVALLGVVIALENLQQKVSSLSGRVFSLERHVKEAWDAYTALRDRVQRSWLYEQQPGVLSEGLVVDGRVDPNLPSADQHPI